jgi:hypothetical protein
MGVLNLDGTLHGIHSAGEVSDETVPSRVEDPTAMGGDQAIDDHPIRGEGAKGADRISPHETAVAFDIGGEDRGELSFDGVRFQPRHLPNPSIARPDARSEGLYAILDETAAVALVCQSSFSILVNFRLATTNYTDDLLGESSASGQEIHFHSQV